MVVIEVQKLGPYFEPIFRAVLLHVTQQIPQATLFWCWVAWLRDQVERPVQPLLLNLDETSVSYTFHQARGLYARRLKRQGRAHAQVPKSDLRGAVTHVAIICERSEVQPRLPQVVIGNTHRFTRRLVARTLASKPANVHVFRGKSSWNNTACMSEILDLLAEALKDFPGFQPILLLDTASCHINDTVAAKAAKLNIWLAPVPAGLTHLLQPLDVHVFSGYKEFLKQEYRKVRSATGSVTPEAWLNLIFSVCSRYLSSHKWSFAFSQVGLGPKPDHLSSELLSFFPNGVPAQPRSCLSSAEFDRLMPKKRKVRALQWVRAPAGRKRVLTVR